MYNTCIHIYIHRYIHTYIHTYTYTLYLRACTLTCTFVHAFIHTHTEIRINSCILAMYTFIHACTHECTHTYKQIPPLFHRPRSDNHGKMILIGNCKNLLNYPVRLQYNICFMNPANRNFFNVLIFRFHC